MRRVYRVSEAHKRWPARRCGGPGTNRTRPVAGAAIALTALRPSQRSVARNPTRVAPMPTPQATPRAAAKHPSGDKRFKLLEVAMKKHQFRPDALIEVLHAAQQLFGYLELDLLLFVA